MLSTKMIGDKITEARKKSSISQAGLAELLFISPQAVGKWERGESMPDIITLNRLAEILQVDLNYFSEGFQLASPEEKSAESVQSPAGKQKQEKKLNWDMSKGSWADADFSGLKNLNEKFSSSHMKNCKFIGSDLSGLQLSDNHVMGCDFSQSDLSNSRLKSSHIKTYSGNAYGTVLNFREVISQDVISRVPISQKQFLNPGESKKVPWIRYIGSTLLSRECTWRTWFLKE